MCFGKCARYIGYSLVLLAVLCIVANILLYFPNGETKYAYEDHLSRFVWYFTGIVGGGILVSFSELFSLQNSSPLERQCAFFLTRSFLPCLPVNPMHLVVVAALSLESRMIQGWVKLFANFIRCCFNKISYLRVNSFL